MYDCFFFPPSVDNPGHNALLDTLESTDQEASPNPAGVLSRHQNWRRTFPKSPVINPVISERRSRERKPFIRESGVCVCLRGGGKEGWIMLDIIQACDRVGGGASIVYRDAYAPSLHADAKLQRSSLLPASQRRIIFPLQAQCRRLHGEHASLHWIR